MKSDYDEKNYNKWAKVETVDNVVKRKMGDGIFFKKSKHPEPRIGPQIYCL